MTTNADYAALITSEHRDKPDFNALVTLYVGPLVDAQNLLQAMPDYFDIDLAIGVQLDALGQWIGVARTITIQPSDAFPTPSTPYQVNLDDDTYRRLLKARALANSWDGTPVDAAAVLAAFYAPAGQAAAILDNQDMSIDLYLVGAFPTPAEAAVLSQFLLPLRPSTVRVRKTRVGPTGGPLFGLSVENEFIAGPGVGSFGASF
jgi:hypothetical protein